MNNGELGVSNYNYDCTTLLERLRALFDRDGKLLGDVAIRSVLVSPDGSIKQHVMTRIDVLPKTITPDPPELRDYGTILFVKDSISRETLLSRLAALSEKRFQIGEQTITSVGLGFHDTYEPSRNSYCESPCRVFEISFGSVQLSYEPLLHPTLKSYSSIYDAIQEFFTLETFNGQSDGHLGQIQIVIPNLNAYIENLALIGKRLHIKTDGVVPLGTLKLAVKYKHEKRIETVEARLQNRDTTLELAFSPSELSIWLVSQNGFLADFHSENKHHSSGANPVLPKQREDRTSIPPLLEPIQLFGWETIEKETRRVVVLTALSLEYKAVRIHLKNVQEKTHPRGTVYEQGEFTASDGSLLEICLVEIGPGNAAAARETERAISHFNPDIAVFVGVAGGLKDVEIGDVVVATKVYGYESGKAKREFRPRPQVHDTAYELQQRARAEAKREDWLKRVKTRAKRKFKVLVGPIASGEKVLASSLSAFSSFLRSNYGDALAVEMEGWGFLDAIHASADVRGLVVRGISDLVDDKSKADASGSQLLAAKHASAFAFEVLSKLTTGRSKQTAGGLIDSVGARGSSDRPQTEATAATPSMLRRVARIEEIIKDVVLGKNQSSVAAAMEVIKATDESGRNEVLQELLNYQDCEDQDLLWKALPTIEACAELAPHFFTHAVLSRMANNSDFSVRSSAASICMNLAQVAPDRVPVDILLKLSVHTEDWYVETPANAALKAMARQNPAVLHIFFTRLSSQEPAERAHAADALVEIAKREPEVLDPDELKNAVSALRSVGDKITAARLAKLLPRVKRSPRLDRYKYGL